MVEHARSTLENDEIGDHSSSVQGGCSSCRRSCSSKPKPSPQPQPCNSDSGAFSAVSAFNTCAGSFQGLGRELQKRAWETVGRVAMCE